MGQVDVRAPTLRWRAPEVQEVLWREWDGEYVVFSAATASTHLLSSSAGLVLQYLLETGRAMTEFEIMHFLFPAGEKTVGRLPIVRSELQLLLQELERIGLARRQSP